MTASRAVVVVSGGGAISPFTTPSMGCAKGLSAGSTDTGLREALLARGFAVYTSPANLGQRPVEADTEFAGFADPPEVLPAALTVNAAGDIDLAGQHLARFLAFLADREGLDTVDLVVHSMGGLFSRAAIRELRRAESALHIGSLVTLGTPYLGAFPADVALGTLDIDAAGDDQITRTIITEFATMLDGVSEGAGAQVTRSYLGGPDGWNARQGAQLDGIPLTMVAGNHCRLDDGDPQMWPHDGLVAVASAFAEGVSSAVLRPVARHLLDDVHSIFFAAQLGVPWQRALTWDPEVFDIVETALRAAGN